MTMVKSQEKKKCKIVFLWWCSEMLRKSEFWKGPFEKMDTASYKGKNDGVWWGVFKEYLKQNIIMAVLRKANAHSVVICRLIKKSIM